MAPQLITFGRLNAGPLLGMGRSIPGQDGEAAPQITFTERGYEDTESNATEYTFTQVPSGVNTSGRHVILLAFGEDGNGAAGNIPDAVTLDGISPDVTHLTHAGTHDNEGGIGVYGWDQATLTGDTGTTMDAVVTWPDGMVRSGVLIADIVDFVSSTLLSTAEDTGASGVAVMGEVNGAADAEGFVWCNHEDGGDPPTVLFTDDGGGPGGVTETQERTYGGDVNASWAFGTISKDLGNPATVTATWSKTTGAADVCGIVCLWR